MKALWTVTLSVLLCACATAPKPQELIDLEVLRKSPTYEQAQKQQPDLVKESDAAYSKSLGFWEDEEMDQAKHWAMLSTIKVRTAEAIIAQRKGRAQVGEVEQKLAQAKEEHQRVQAKIREADEQLALIAKLAAARKAAKEKEAQLQAKLSQAEQQKAKERQLAEAQRKVGEAQLALKQADTVQASSYAKAEYQTAQSLITKAEAALKAENATDAKATAELAKSKAEAAFNAAKPQYMAAQKKAENQARNQALQKDAAALPGVTVRMKAVGDTQQLIIPVKALFKPRKAAIKADKQPTINAIGELLKKYPGYPVLVNGYTSYRTRRSQRYVLTQSRAQAVANVFVSQGVPFKRMAISGHGAEDPVARKYSNINDRVEVIILFQ